MTNPARASGLTLDAGALIAIDRGDERMIALLRAARRARLSLVVPAGALAQAWRDGKRQARLAGFLRARPDGPVLAPLDGPAARAAGELCGRTGTADIVDASVALCARTRHHQVVTSDPGDFERLDPRVRVVIV